MAGSAGVNGINPVLVDDVDFRGVVSQDIIRRPERKVKTHKTDFSPQLHEKCTTIKETLGKKSIVRSRVKIG